MSDTAYKIKVAKGDGCHRKLTVKVHALVVKMLQDHLVLEYAANMKTKGFRKGKVPRALVLKRHGKAILKEVMDAIISDIWDEILKDESLIPAGDPDYDLDVVDAAVVIVIDYEVRPVVKIGRLGGFRVERPIPAEITQSDIDQYLRELRMMKTAWRRVDSGRPEPGDKVTVRITQLNPESAHGEDSGGHGVVQHAFILGEGEAAPEVEEALHTLAPGESGVFGLMFREDDSEETRGGSRRDVRIELVTRRVTELPELNDDFVRSIEGANANTVDELREQVTKMLKARALAVVEEVVDMALWEHATEAHSFDVPDCWVEKEIDWVYQHTVEDYGVTHENPEELRDGLRPLILSRLKREIFRKAVIREMDLRPNEEVAAENIFDEVAEDMGMSARDMRDGFGFIEDDKELRDRIANTRFQYLLRSKSKVVDASP